MNPKEEGDDFMAEFMKRKEEAMRQFRPQFFNNVTLDDRPDRKTVINKDDILNLNIALNTATSIEELCAMV